MTNFIISGLYYTSLIAYLKDRGSDQLLIVNGFIISYLGKFF